jgi:hypothetical protein
VSEYIIETKGLFMKKLLMAAVAVSAIAATPAFAADFPITATVGASCGAITGSTIAFSAIATGADGTLTAGQSASSSSQAVYCNGAGSTITVTSTELLTSPGVVASGFTKTLGFTTDVNFAGVHRGTGAAQALGAVTGTLIVSANNLTASAKPQAGDYTGLIQVTVAPIT